MVGETVVRRKKERRNRNQSEIVSQKGSPDYGSQGCQTLIQDTCRRPARVGALRLKGTLQICRYRDHGNLRCKRKQRAGAGGPWEAVAV
jgi:hypothetical protein